MYDHDNLVTALVRTLERDGSAQALRQATTALQLEHGLSASRAYAMLVRARAGLPARQLAPVPALTDWAPSQASLLAS
jgi:hypothetical protein